MPRKEATKTKKSPNNRVMAKSSTGNNKSKAISSKEDKFPEERKLFLSEKLQKEQQMTSYNRTKLNSKWLEIMRLEKLQDLKTEIEMVKESFEEIIGKKDGMVSMLKNRLVDDKKACEEILDTQMKHLNTLKEIQTERANTLRSSFGSMVKSVKDDIARDINAASHQQETEIRAQAKELEDTKENYDKRLALCKSEFDGSLENIALKNIANVKEAIANKEDRVENLTQQLQDANIDYEARTAQLRQAYEQLVNKDEKDKEEMETQECEISHLTDSIEKMKTALNEDNKSHIQFKAMSPLNSLKKENATLKNKLTAEEKESKERLKKVAVESEDTIATLTNIRNTLEKIIKLEELCRRLEYASEAAEPSGYEGPGDTALDEETRTIKQQIELLQKSWVGCQPMEQFWKRYNKVVLETSCLQIEKQNLIERNEELKNALKNNNRVPKIVMEAVEEKPPLMVESYY